MPADLSNPFGESCCDGGGTSGRESARPCGCDYGMCPAHLCAQHKFKEAAMLLITEWRKKEKSSREYVDTDDSCWVWQQCSKELESIL